ncbi:MAG: zinc ribbon domain-containing protein [Candidatus Helarchaeota archaeon]
MSNYAELFTCERCGNPLVAGIVTIVKDNANVISKCIKGHKKTIKLPMEDMIKWIDILTKHIYQCRCGEELTDLKMSTTGETTNLTLYCKTHKERPRKIATILWTAISNARAKMLEKELVIEEDSETPPPPPQKQAPIVKEPIPSTPKINQETVISPSLPEKEDLETHKSRICPTCGETLPEDATKFCPYCGMEL